MKQKIQKKLHEKTGASLIFALLALLVVTLISSNLIAASLSSAHQLQDDKESRQATIALDCAANLVQKEFCKARYYTSPVPKEYPSGDGLSVFNDVLALLCSEPGSASTLPYRLQAPSMPDVSVVFSRNARKIYATLTVEDPGSASQTRSMKLEFSYNGGASLEADPQITEHACTFVKAQ